MKCNVLNTEDYVIKMEDVLNQFDENEQEFYESILEELLEDTEDVAKPVGIWTELPVKILSDSEVEIGEESFYSSYLVKCLEGVDKVYGFAVSIGKSLWQYRVNTSDALEELLFDGIMKACLDDIFASVAIEIVKQLPDKTMLFMDNPGHLDGWDIADQNKLLSMLTEDVEDDSLHINGEYLFENSFSMSGIIYNKGTDTANCSICPKEDCSHRKLDFSKKLLISRLYESSGRYEN